MSFSFENYFYCGANSYVFFIIGKFFKAKFNECYFIQMIDIHNKIETLSTIKHI